MDAAFTAEQDEIRRALRELVAKRCGPDEAAAAARTPQGYDTALWQTLAEQLALPGLAVPEEFGGAGGTTTELALAGEEMGRALAPSPLLASAVLAAPLIARLGTEEQRRTHLPDLAAGRTTAALALPGASLATALGLAGDGTGDWAGGGRAGGVQAGSGSEGWRLYGQAEQVLDGHSADLLVVAAHTGGFARSRTLLFLVRADAPGVVAVRRTVLDETRPQARVELRDAQAELLGVDDAPAVADALAATGDAAAAVLAAEAAGAAEAALARTVEQTRERERSGRAGSFRAARNRLADVYVTVQAARSAAYYAALGEGAAADGARRGGALALAQALEALRAASTEAVQLSGGDGGGDGSTWEDAAHRYFKRAAGDELLFGPVHRLREQAAERAGLFGAEVAV
ncbi:acyl-CoA dehydrogenase family protein [Streptomyces cavernicola]|uniref:Acyl-CoA dehydrogenase family protein n=1 Tax=Streptomyces cavernicola TaxID=3043613 RepID=A0ABT6SI99_9ACTN|nr:acyl-CoA dehydrogenase family protein [Streptomyces sp. B-S-A6]MDI3407928.1 acyl-CoA dehydrogenase family protein [Streptomyces sp. B-S-A6]